MKMKASPTGEPVISVHLRPKLKLSKSVQPLITRTMEELKKTRGKIRLAVGAQVQDVLARDVMDALARLEGAPVGSRIRTLRPWA